MVPWTPQLASTTWVTPTSAPTDITEIASSSLRPCTVIRNLRSFRHRHRIIHPSTLADAPVVDIAPCVTRRNRADEVRFRRRKTHGAEMQPRRYFHAGQDVLPLADGRVIDPHAGIVDGRVYDSV